MQSIKHTNVNARPREAGLRARVSAERIDSLLPQLHCRKCGYDGCQPYAEAIAMGTADINQCPPGGAALIETLATLLGHAPKPLDSTRGAHRGGLIACIDERSCIGCALCLQACPVDAILGTVHRMHTVIGAECTGCELCIAPCPVDCIAMISDPTAGNWTGADRADLARRRYAARRERLAREQAERAARRRPKIPAPDKGKSAVTPDPRKVAIQAALERVRAKRAALRQGAKKPASPA